MPVYISTKVLHSITKEAHPVSDHDTAPSIVLQSFSALLCLANVTFPSALVSLEYKYGRARLSGYLLRY